MVNRYRHAKTSVEPWVTLSDYKELIAVFKAQYLGAAPVRELEGAKVVTEAG